jgi:hypothetical protein
VTPLRRRVGASIVGWALVTAACTGGQPSVEDFCREVGQLIETDLVNFEFSAADDPAVRSGLARTASQLEDVEAASPDVIRPSVEVLAGLTRAYADAVAESDPHDPFERSAALLAAQQEFEDDLPDALTAYNAYVAHNCTPEP